MKRKQVTALLIGTLVTAAAMTGCGKEKNEDKVAVAAPTATPTPVQSPTPAPTATPVPVKTMGEKVQGAYEILLKNSTGKVITGVSVKSEKEEEYKSNLLMQKDSFTVNEERILFYKTSGEENADAQAEKPSYNVRLTFEDETEAVLHNFPFGDMTKAEIHMEDEVVYLTYTSASTKAPVSTKAAEMMAAGEEEAAPTPTPAAVENNAPAGNSNQGNQTPSYDNDYNTGGGSAGGSDNNTGGGSTGGGNTGGGNNSDGPAVNPGGDDNTGNGNNGDGPAINPGDDNNTGGGNNGDGPAVNPGGDDNTGGGDDNTGGGNTGGGDDNTGGGSTGGGDDNTGGGNAGGGDDGGHSDIVEQ